MLRPIDQYFNQQVEPTKGCLVFLREYLLQFNPEITEHWQYGMPFYYYAGKRICYLWLHKKFKQPYLGIVEGKLIEHPRLLAEKRARMKILLIDPSKNIPLATVKDILNKIIALHK